MIQTKDYDVVNVSDPQPRFQGEKTVGTRLKAMNEFQNTAQKRPNRSLLYSKSTTFGGLITVIIAPPWRVRGRSVAGW